MNVEKKILECDRSGKTEYREKNLLIQIILRQNCYMLKLNVPSPSVIYRHMKPELGAITL